MDKSNYVYIAALGRSGSTLLASLLSQNPNYLSVGEFFPGIIWRDSEHLCSCGKPVRCCDFYKEILDSLSTTEQGWLREGDVLLNKMLIREKLSLFPSGIGFVDSIQDFFLLDERLKKYAAIIEKIAEKMLEINGARAIIDGSKQYYLLNLYRRRFTRSIKIIHLIRNPLGVYASRKRTNPIEVRNFCSSYNRYLSLNRQFKTQANIANYCEISYDQLISNPNEQILKLHNFIGFPSFDKNQVKTQHIGGNASRLQHEVQLKLDERWKKELTEDEKLYIQKHVISDVS